MYGFGFSSCQDITLLSAPEAWAPVAAWKPEGQPVADSDVDVGHYKFEKGASLDVSTAHPRGRCLACLFVSPYHVHRVTSPDLQTNAPLAEEREREGGKEGGKEGGRERVGERETRRERDILTSLPRGAMDSDM